MSAWIVSKAHIDVLVHALGKRELLSTDPNTAGAILWGENYRSVNFRYDESEAAPAYAFEPPPVAWTPNQLLKILGCYDYQTCECDDYRATEAGELVTILQDSLAREGADEDSDEWAPWGVCHCGQAHEDYKHDESGAK